MVLTKLSFFYFVVNKKNKFYSVMMDQKTEYELRFKKDSI